MINSPNHLTRRNLLKTGVASAALGSLARPKTVRALRGSVLSLSSNPKVKIWDGKEYNSTIGFELPELAGEVFKIVIPELISDSTEPIVPWKQPSPVWEIGENSAHSSLEIPGRIRTKVTVLFRDEQIETQVTVTNLSPRTWERLNAFTCFAYYSAPAFDDPHLTRTYFPVNGEWKSIAELFAAHDPGSGPYTFFPVLGGPQLDDFWLCREIPQRHVNDPCKVYQFE